jgi:hypothetical protein
MADPGEGFELETRVAQLASDLKTLSQKVERLERLLSSGEALGATDLPSQGSVEVGAEPETRPASWSATTTTVLSRAATACFLLVVALILRTVTDNGLLAPAAGSVVGIGYSSLLVCAAWVFYRRGIASASVFAVSGACLLFAVVLETHRNLHVLSLPASYALLSLMGGAATVISRQFGAAAAGYIGVIGMLAAGAVLNLSNPLFPDLGALLLIASGLAYASSRRPRADGLRAFVLSATVAFWLIWAFNLNGALARHGEVAREMGLRWFLPLLAATVFFQWATAYRGSVLPRGQKPRFLDTILPVFTAVWAYGAAAMVAIPWHRSQLWLGLAGVTVSAALFIAGSRVAQGSGPGARGIVSFSSAGVVLLALALPLGGHKSPILLPLISATAFALGVISARWGSAGARLVSYLLQVFVFVFALASGAFSTSDASALSRGLGAAAVTCTSFLHYRWCRRHPPQGTAGFFGTLDKSDDTAVSLLLASLLGAFLALRVGMREVVDALVVDPANAFLCCESVVINLGALALVIAAFYLRNTEVRAVAIAVIVAGALKVFLIDLFAASGIPLVMSVLSFGIAAGVGALVLRRWLARDVG